MRLLIIALIAAFMGCATIPPENVSAVQRVTSGEEIGWVANGDSGYAWAYKNQKGLMVGSCYIVKIRMTEGQAKQETWLAKYYGKKRTDGKYPEQLTGSLCECVSWVEGHIFGGYYL